tara:strand:- start:1882 stop:2112 length:231 start_codon:yes stop_codon:yes gene_type:complete
MDTITFEKKTERKLRSDIGLKRKPYELKEKDTKEIKEKPYKKRALRSDIGLKRNSYVFKLGYKLNVPVSKIGTKEE